MSGNRIFKALGATIVLLVITVALVSPKFLDYFKGALVLFLEGEPNITYDHEDLDEPSEFENVTPDYVTALEDAGIDISSVDMMDTNLTIYKAKKPIEIPVNAPYKLSVEASNFDAGSNIIEVAAALMDSSLITPETITGQCEDELLSRIPTACEGDLISIASGIDLLRFFNLKNNPLKNTYDILLPPLGIELNANVGGAATTGGTNSLTQQTKDFTKNYEIGQEQNLENQPAKSNTLGDAGTNSLTSGNAATSVGIGFENNISLNPDDFVNGGTDVGFLQENFGINTDGSIPRALVVVSTNTPVSNYMLDKANLVYPSFSSKVDGFYTDDESDKSIQIGGEQYEIVLGEQMELGFMTNLDSVDTIVQPISKTTKAFSNNIDSTTVIVAGDKAGKAVERTLTANENGEVSISWDGECNYNAEGDLSDLVEECDYGLYNYLYIRFLDEEDNDFARYLVPLKFVNSEGSELVNIESPIPNTEFYETSEDIYRGQLVVFNNENKRFDFVSSDNIAQYKVQTIWSDSAIFDGVTIDETGEIDFEATTLNSHIKYSELKTTDLTTDTKEFSYEFKHECNYKYSFKDEVTTEIDPIEKDCEQTGKNALLFSTIDDEGKATSFIISLEFEEPSLSTLSTKDSIFGTLQRMYGKIIKSLMTNSLNSGKLEVIVQIIPVEFVEGEPLPDEVVVSGEDLETSDDLFEYIKAKTYFDDRVEVQDLKFEPGYESTVGQGFGGLFDYMTEECAKTNPNVADASMCQDLQSGMARDDAIRMGKSILDSIDIPYQIFRLHSDQEVLKVYRDQINELSFKTNDGYREYYAFVIGDEFENLVGIGTNIIIEFFGRFNFDFKVLLNFVHNFGFAGFGFTDVDMNPGHIMLQDGVANNLPDSFNSFLDFSTFNDKTSGGTLIIVALDQQLINPYKSPTENFQGATQGATDTPLKTNFFTGTGINYDSPYFNNMTVIDEDTVYINFINIPNSTDEKTFELRIIDDADTVISDTVEVTPDFVAELSGSGSPKNTFLDLADENVFVPGVSYTLQLLENSIPIREINFYGYNSLLNAIDTVTVDRDEIVLRLNSGLYIGSERSIQYRYAFDDGEMSEITDLMHGSQTQYIDLVDTLTTGDHTFKVEYCDFWMGCYLEDGDFVGAKTFQKTFNYIEPVVIAPRFYVVPLEFVDPEVIEESFYAQLDQPILTNTTASRDDEKAIITDDAIEIMNGDPIDFLVSSNAKNLNYTLNIHARSKDQSTQDLLDNYSKISEGETLKRGADVISDSEVETIDNNVSFTWDGNCNYNFSAIGLASGGFSGGLTETIERECDESLNHFIEIIIEDSANPGENVVSYFFPIKFVGGKTEPTVECSLTGDTAGPYNPVNTALRLTAFTKLDGEILDEDIYAYSLGIYQGETQVHSFDLTKGEFDDLWYHTEGNVNNYTDAQSGVFDAFLDAGDYQARYDVGVAHALVSGDPSVCGGELTYDFTVGEPTLPDEEPELVCPDTEFPTLGADDDYDTYSDAYDTALAEFTDAIPDTLECNPPEKADEPRAASGGGGPRASAPSTSNSNGFCASGVFSDIEKDDPMYPAVEFATTIGFTGKPDAKCSPKKRIDLYGKFNRVEYAKISSLLVAQFQKINIDLTAIKWVPEDGKLFSDTNFAASDQAWQANHIKRATQIGTFRGYLGEKDAKTGLAPFKAANEISYAEFIKVSFIALGLGDANEFNKKQEPWYGSVMEAAKDAGLPSYEQFKYAPTKTLTRGDAISILYEIKQKGLWPSRVKAVSFSD